MKDYDFAGTRKMLTDKYGKSITSTDVVSYCSALRAFWGRADPRSVPQSL